MTKEQTEALEKEHKMLKEKLKNTKRMSTSLKIEKRMIEISKILQKEKGK